ncbi:unnamed protein product [Clonostachys rhizophaga]|uniref:Glycoside hydrolase family 12 protein n=1 Tax=Clonostachys rhizophaga TaxID=160324 RepID=A0A9N9YD35_9HYPO|nr:unnamed protein product [Clonostachys rhizophaga]
MKFMLSFVGITALAAAAPSNIRNVEPTKTEPLEKRATTLCGQWDSVETGGYTIYNNLWGKDSGSGSQCLTVDGISNMVCNLVLGGGGTSVKSYPNAVLSASAARVSTISSIPSKWQWTYTGSGVVANVAYDLFSNTDCGTIPEFEIMIWLSAIGGAGPISATGSSIATVTIAGASWKLWKGTNSQMTVFSFVAESAQNNFSGDLNGFIKYLTQTQGYSGSQCLYSIGAGTEPFVGSNAQFTTTGYSVSLSAGSSGGDEGSSGDSGGGIQTITTSTAQTQPTATGTNCAGIWG